MIRLRPHDPIEGSRLREFVRREIGTNRYVNGPLHALEIALGEPTWESRTLVADDDGEIVGLALYGIVPGTEGAGKLHIVVVTAAARLKGVARSLADAAANELADAGARFVVAECPSDPALAPACELLSKSGFREVSRVSDYYRDGIDLVLWRREIAGTPTSSSVV